MFVRNVSLRLKPNTLSEFTRIFEKEVIPILRKQRGFRDEIAFAVPGELDLVAISLWDTKEYAEAYKTAIQSLTPHALNRMPISIHLRPTARLNMSSTMLSHKSILTHGMTATSAWFLTPSGRSVPG